MFRAIQLMRFVPIVAAVSICVCAGDNKDAVDFGAPLVHNSSGLKYSVANADVRHVQRSTAESFNAKLPRGGTVCTWVGPSTGNWEDASSWSCGHVPTSTNDVEIFTGNVTLNSVAA